MSTRSSSSRALRGRTLVAFLLTCVCAGSVAIAQEPTATPAPGVSFDITPAPAWVTPFTADAIEISEADEGGLAHLLVDRQ